MSNSTDLGETVSKDGELLAVSSGYKLFAYGTIVVLVGLRVKIVTDTKRVCLEMRKLLFISINE